MWGEPTRSRRVAFKVTLVGVAVFVCWQLATASPAPFLQGLFPPSPEDPRERPRYRALPGGASVVDASFAASSASRIVAAVPWAHSRPVLQNHPAPEPEEPQASSDSPPVSLLPSVSEERSHDGLPAAAMRCRRTAEGLDCGSCRVDGDCPAGQGCVANRETRRFECLASECEEDSHCFPGSVCRPVTTGATGAVIRRCTPEGQRREGEPCDSLPVSPASSCREGLRCVNQVCSAPCSLDGSVQCASGFVCTDSLNGPGCAPDCQRLGCPEGQRCTRIPEGRYQCLADSQGDCRENPCAEGERCNMRMSRGHAVFWCARVCNPLRSDSCPSDNVCGVGSPTVSTCFRKCDPGDLNSCGPGWVCSTVTEDMSVFGCSPDMQR
jgi:hypothetical protein